MKGDFYQHFFIPLDKNLSFVPWFFQTQFIIKENTCFFDASNTKDIPGYLPWPSFSCICSCWRIFNLLGGSTNFENKTEDLWAFIFCPHTDSYKTKNFLQPKKNLWETIGAFRPIYNPFHFPKWTTLFVRL